MADVHQISNGLLSLSVQDAGAALCDVRLAGMDRNLVLGFQDPADHQSVPIYAGAIVGPVANRIRGGLVQIDGVTHQMDRNEQGQTALHSGSDGLHGLVWNVTHKTAPDLHLECRLAEGACGLPGDRVFAAAYTLKDTTFTLRLTAKTTATTPVTLAAHPYWNLDGQADVSTHRLQVFAEHYLPVDVMNLPTGETARTYKSPFDFAHLRPLSQDPALDVNFCLSRAPRQAPRPAAKLVGADGTTLEIHTTAPGLQVYAGAHLPHLPGRLAGQADLRPFGAIALEPQLWPDALAHPHFPSILLRPGQIWVQETRYCLQKP